MIWSDFWSENSWVDIHFQGFWEKAIIYKTDHFNSIKLCSPFKVDPGNKNFKKLGVIDDFILSIWLRRCMYQMHGIGTRARISKTDFWTWSFQSEYFFPPRILLKNNFCW